MEYTGIIKAWKSPYFMVVYADNDKEEFRLSEVLPLIDVDQFLVADKLDVDDVEEDLLDNDRFEPEPSDDESDSVADSKNSKEDSNVTVLTKDQCIPNDILKVQKVVISQLYDQTTSPIRFNKVNDSKEVNKVAALQILKYCEERHMSRVEAEEYLKSTHNLIELVTHKPFDMVRSYKTLKRVFLWSTDKKIPLSQTELELPPKFFSRFRRRGNRPMPTVKAAYIPLEVSIGLLLLKLSPEDIIENFVAEYWKGTNNDGEESVERIYTNWASGKYAADLQRFFRDNLETQHVPLLLCFSVFIDKGLMNGVQSRSTTPVSIALQNGRNKHFQTLVGFVPDESGTSPEVLDGLLEEQGINMTQRKFIMQHTKRQREWDYLHQVFTPFLHRQDESNGFDVQIGTGTNAKFYRIFVVFTNFLADSPQMHSLTGVSNSACHCACVKILRILELVIVIVMDVMGQYMRQKSLEILLGNIRLE